MPTFGRFRGRTNVSAFTATHRRFSMLRRPVVLVALSLVTLTLSACSDVTGPTSSERQIKPSAAPSANLCTGGSLDASGKC